MPLLSLNLITALMLSRKKILSLCFAVIVLLWLYWCSLSHFTLHVTPFAIDSHRLIYVHLPDSSFLFRVILSRACICFSHSLFLCFIFPSCALQVDYVTLKYFGKNPLQKMLCKEISISRYIAFLIHAYQGLIRYQSLAKSSEEQYVIIVKVMYWGPF